MDKFIKVDVLKGNSLLTIVNAIRFVTKIDIRKVGRKRELVYLRKIYVKLAKENTNLSLTEIANFALIDSHATVLFHLNDVDNILIIDKWKKIYDEVSELFDRTKEKEVCKVQVEKDRVIYFVERVVEVSHHIEYVEKLVDVYDTGIPSHIINHLMDYTREELDTLYETRLKPFKVFAKINR